MNITQPSGEPPPLLFEIPVEVTDAHVEAPGHHVNNVVYVRWVQEAATAHWRAMAPPDLRDTVVWYVLRHEIDYLKETFVGDRLIVRTHVGESRGARFERFVEIAREDGVVVARAHSTWAAIDARSGRPRRITPEMKAPFFASDEGTFCFSAPAAAPAHPDG